MQLLKQQIQASKENMMDLRTRILEDDQAAQANAGQVQPNPEALATIGKAIA